jgi:hypothetical protein
MRKSLIAVLILFVGVPIVAQAWTLQWGAVTQYTTGEAISKPVKYTVWIDGTQAGNNISATSFLLPNPGSGVAHVYEVAAVVDNVTGGKASVNFTSPYLTPAAPGAVGVVP